MNAQYTKQNHPISTRSDKVWEGGAYRAAEWVECANFMVEQLMIVELHLPKVVRTIVCRHLGVITALAPRGPLYDSSCCYNVLDGAEGGLDYIIPSPGGSQQARFRALWLKFKEDRNPACNALLPPETPQSLEHLLCELRKLKDRKKIMLRAAPRCPEQHRHHLRACWDLLWHGAASVPVCSFTQKCDEQCLYCGVAAQPKAKRAKS